MRTKPIVGVAMSLLISTASLAQITLSPQAIIDREDVLTFVTVPLTNHQLNAIGQSYNRTMVEPHFVGFMIDTYGSNYKKTMTNAEIDELRIFFRMGVAASLAKSIDEGSSLASVNSGLESQGDCAIECAGNIQDQCGGVDALPGGTVGATSWAIAMQALAVSTEVTVAGAGIAFFAGAWTGCALIETLGCFIGCGGVGGGNQEGVHCSAGATCWASSCPDDGVGGVNWEPTGESCIIGNGDPYYNGGVEGVCCEYPFRE